MIEIEPKEQFADVSSKRLAAVYSSAGASTSNGEEAAT